MKRVSVVVPAYNEEFLLPACLEALRAQDYGGEIELIVVDNASTDRTAMVARRFGVTLVEEPKRGYCSALIAGFARATGEIIAMTDADSIAPRDWVSRLVLAYEQMPEAVAIGGEIEYFDPNWKGRLITRGLLPLIYLADRQNPRGHHLWGGNFSVRRSAFLAVGGWNPDYELHADAELSERLRQAGKVVLVRSLAVRSSCRRWNRAFLSNVFLFASNYVWSHVVGRPLWREFPPIRDEQVVTGAVPAVRRRHAVTAFGLAALVLVSFFAFEGAVSPRSSAFGKTYWNGATPGRVVALTFDDGPNEPYTSQVLDILKREHVRATFFLIGENVRRSPATAARIVREGHVVGNHSDSHPDFLALLPTPDEETEVAKAEASIRAATGRSPRFFRPPHGARSPWLMHVLEADSMVTVTWGDAPGDWDALPVPVIVDRTLHQAHPGSIILLHDGMNLEKGANQSRTVRALPAIIEDLRRRGYAFATVPELLQRPAYFAR